MWFSTVCLISAPRIIRQPRCLFHMQHMTLPKVSISGLCKCGGARCNYPRRKPRPWLRHSVQTATAGPDSYDRSHALWVHLPIQLHAAWPVPFRLAFHCRGLVRDIPEHWGQLNEKGPLDGLLCLSPSDDGDARVGPCTGRRHTQMQDRRVYHHDKSTTDNEPHEAGSLHWLRRRNRQPSARLCNGNSGG